MVKQLLNLKGVDLTVVAFVRDYEKALEVLYDSASDGGLVKRDDVRAREAGGGPRGPRLKIVVGDVVPPEDVHGFVDAEDEIMLEYAASASGFYNESINSYDYRHERPPPDEALEECVRGCTAIVSCVGTVRPTNVWTDLIVRPFVRILRSDVSGWCDDARHPYYVNYEGTRKVLRMAEREQRRREAVAAEAATAAAREEAEEARRRGGYATLDEDDEEAVRKRAEELSKIERIKIVRISDLCVAQKAWSFVPMVTNAFQSVVFRYQDMAERSLEESRVVDTIVLRPGDLVNAERNTTTTSLQVCSSGAVPTPARVGRADVAALAVAAALTNVDGAEPAASNATGGVVGDGGDAAFPNPGRPSRPAAPRPDEPVHYSLGVRWSSESLDPFPPQGTKADGLRDAWACMAAVVRKEARNAKRRRMLERRRDADFVRRTLSRLTRPLFRRRRKIKPYGIFVALPVYLSFFVIALLFSPALRVVPGYEIAAAFVGRRWGTVTRRLPKVSIQPPNVFAGRGVSAPRSYISF